MSYNVKLLSLVFNLALLDALSIFLLLLLYLTGVDFITLVNINFLLMSTILGVYALGHIRANTFGCVFLIAIVLSVYKFGHYFFDGNNPQIKLIFTHLISLFIPFFALNITSTVSKFEWGQIEKILHRFAVRYALIAIPGIILYFTLYSIGQVNYFGLGSNLHYIYPFFVTNAVLKPSLLFFIIVLFTGKRAVLVNFLIQLLLRLASTLNDKPIQFIFALSTLVIFFALVLTQTTFLHRFNATLTVDFSDAYMLLTAFGGRFEEIMGVYSYFSQFPERLVLGAPPGDYYTWSIAVTNYSELKNYAHLTIVAYLFRYGLLITLLVYGGFLFMLIRYFSPREPLYLCLVGIVSSSFFGANLLSDPTAWLLIGLLIRKHKLSIDSQQPQVT